MNANITRRQQVLLAALQRAGKPMTNSDLRDLAIGLAAAEGWDETMLESNFSRRSVAALMRNLIRDTNLIREGAEVFDTEARKMTPAYTLVSQGEGEIDVPAPPMAAPADDVVSPDAMTREQALAVIQVGDLVCAAVARFMHDMQDVQERARRALETVGLETWR